MLDKGKYYIFFLIIFGTVVGIISILTRTEPKHLGIQGCNKIVKLIHKKQEYRLQIQIFIKFFNANTWSNDDNLYGTVNAYLMVWEVY